MKVREFSGGLNNRVDPSLIAENEAVIYANVDNTSGVLKSIKEPLIDSSAGSIFGYFYNFKDTWLSSSGQRSYSEYKEVVYWTEDNQKPGKFDGSRISNMGIVGPTTLITVVEQAVIAAPASTPTTAQADPPVDEIGISDDAETLVYCYTYYDSVSGRESTKSPDAVGLALAANKDVLISNITASVTDGIDKIRIYRTGDGITTMTLVMEVSNASDDLTDNIRTANLSTDTLKADVGISGDAETLQYCYTYYNSQEGIESTPSELSEELAIAANKEVLISSLVASEDIQVDKIRIYRIGDGVTEFTLVREIPNEDGNFIDSIDTANLPATLMDTINNLPPPDGSKYLTEAYGIMFVAVNDKLRFSIQGKPNYWPAANEIDFAREITGIFPVPNGLLVFSRTKTDILTGNNVGNFAVLPVSTEHGSVSHYSGKLVKNVPTWVSLDGIASYAGGIIQIISKDKLGKKTFNVVNSAVYDEQYHLCLSDGSLMVMDNRFALAFKTFTLASKVDNILTYDDTLYGRQGDKLVKLFSGLVDTPFEYLSPVFTDGEHTNSKLYNNIYIRSDSSHEFGIEIRVYIDGAEVMYDNLKGNTIHDITPPVEQQRGSGIQFSLKGIGTVYEIEYKVVGRQNGR